MTTSPPQVVGHPDARAFLARAEPWLLRREARNNLVLGFTSLAARSPDRYQPPLYFATIERADQVVGCAFRTPPYKLGLTRIPLDAAPPLARDVARVYEAIPGVLGPVDAAQAVADAWAGLRGARATPGLRQRIHRLDSVRFPSPIAPGGMRMATDADLPVLIPWLTAFRETTGPRVGEEPEATARRLIDGGSLALWVDQAPVSMASFPLHTRNTGKISHVYTPRAYRRRGYASALVAHLSSHILESGFRHAVLFTDLANPTANHIYHEVGYRPVEDVMEVDFP